jgi:protein involved in polysaccharide export with SLBB domain
MVSWLLALALQCAAQELSSYKLGPGDTISIRVLGEEELRRERVRLSDAGTISFPVLGELKVRGLTIGAVEEQVAAGLRGRYLLNPQVNVTIDEYRPFFLNGMIERPGSYPFAPGMTVRKAITVAGGFKERAARDKINIIRDDDAKQISRRVDLNAPVLPGDIVTVEESFF